MLYKKYTIEIIYEVSVSETLGFTPSSTYSDEMSIKLNSMTKMINTIKFSTIGGDIIDYPFYFDSYDEAFETLKTHYYTFIGDYKIKDIKICESYNDIIPPLPVLRSLKIKQIFKNK